MAKKVSYFDNLMKEVGDRSRAKDRQLKASDEAKYGIMGIKQPGAQARASKASKSLRNATGQLAGALLQGRRYDDKGRLITAKAATAKKMTVKKTVAKKPATKKK